MSESLKYLADNLVMSDDCDRRQLNLSHPDAAALRQRDIILASLCQLRSPCEVVRKNPSVHVLIFTLAGKAQLFTEDFPRSGKMIEPGQVVVLPARCAHYYRSEGAGWQAFWFYIADTDIWHQIRDSKPHVRNSITLNELHTAFEGFWNESLRNEPRARVAAQHYAELMVLNLERELDMEESASNREMRQQLYKLWDTVGASLGKPWTVAALADEVCISPQHLYRVSTQLCGHKPMEMVTLLRMRHARELLINTGYAVKAISGLVGYGDAFSFSAAFKKHTGLSPRQFRIENQKKRSVEQEPKWPLHKKKTQKRRQNV